MWQNSKALGVRPSALLGVEDAYVAYCLDDAVVHLGAVVENAMSHHTHKDPKIEAVRRQQALEDILGISKRSREQKKAAPRGFAVPKATIVRKEGT